METFSVLLAICVGNSPVTGEFPAQRPVTRNFDVFFDLRLNKRLSNNLRRHRTHYDLIVMSGIPMLQNDISVCYWFGFGAYGDFGVILASDICSFNRIIICWKSKMTFDLTCKSHSEDWHNIPLRMEYISITFHES